MLSFFCEITQRNEEREIGVTMAGGPKQGVKMPLHVFPNPKAPRANDHAAANIRGFSQLGRTNDLLVPLWEIVFSSWRNGVLLNFCHELNSGGSNRGVMSDLRQQ